MVTVYTELSIKDQKNNKLATLNHIQQENSNLIMPFLVQNDNKTIKGLTTLLLQILKKRSFFLLEMRSISLKCIKLYLCDYKTKSKANLLQTEVSECAWWGILKAKWMRVPGKHAIIWCCEWLTKSVNKNLRYSESTPKRLLHWGRGEGLGRSIAHINQVRIYLKNLSALTWIKCSTQMKLKLSTEKIMFLKKKQPLIFALRRHKHLESLTCSQGQTTNPSH